MARQIQQVSASFSSTGDQQTRQPDHGGVGCPCECRAPLGSQINTVSAVAGSKNKTFQASAPNTGMGTGICGSIPTVIIGHTATAAPPGVATDDPRIAANAAPFRRRAKRLRNLQMGPQAMWTVKASAGQITAGIGLDSQIGRHQPGHGVCQPVLCVQPKQPKRHRPCLPSTMARR